MSSDLPPNSQEVVAQSDVVLAFASECRHWGAGWDPPWSSKSSISVSRECMVLEAKKKSSRGGSLRERCSQK